MSAQSGAMVSKIECTYSATEVQAAHGWFALPEVYERQPPGHREIFVVHNIPGMMRNIVMSALCHADKMKRVPIEYLRSITDRIQ